MGIKGYDQWKTASPYDDDYDPIEEIQKKIKELNWQLNNWETSPGPWIKPLKDMLDFLEWLRIWLEDNL